MDDIPTAQPALALAQKVLARAETGGRARRPDPATRSPTVIGVR